MPSGPISRTGRLLAQLSPLGILIGIGFTGAVWLIVHLASQADLSDVRAHLETHKAAEIEIHRITDERLRSLEIGIVELKTVLPEIRSAVNDVKHSVHDLSDKMDGVRRGQLAATARITEAVERKPKPGGPR